MAATAVSRKRSRIALDPADDDDDNEQAHAHAHAQRHLKAPSPAQPAVTDTRKRTRTQCELDELATVSPEEAWAFDVEALLASKRLAVPTGSSLPAHDNWARSTPGASLLVLCVQGNVQVHYELLCTALPDLYSLSPSLQPLVLCHDPPTHHLPATAPFSLPLVQAAAPSHNLFVRLGLLHPLGGGKLPLDALVVVDWSGRRRLVLPFGWGAGKHAESAAGPSIQRRLMGLLRECVEALELER